MAAPTPPPTVAEDVRRALAEDVGPGDLTAALVPAGRRARAVLLAREAGVLAGAPWLEETFRQAAPGTRVDWLVAEGAAFAAGAVLARIEGPARGMLTAERTALNFLQLLSGTATLARRYVEAVAGTRARILDTRKTVPGLRAAQKYAVRCGGAHNHRMGLHDAVLVKENHIAAAGSIAAAVEAARRLAPQAPLQVEVEDLAGLEEALAAGAPAILLDNFDLATLREAVRRAAGRAELEASGGITLENVRAVAETGVDRISVGALTKDVRALDLSLRFEPP